MQAAWAATKKHADIRYQEGTGNRSSLIFLAYTTPETPEIIRRNLHRAPMYSGGIHGTGARYCPSIEDKGAVAEA